ncbi:hypothetical protein [Rhodalgimonas zhirmunskyi]|uniref:Transmembrane protein n=1 Tax=Rhodalgimonas zhirmunskyi TaxID=2964767 RepID=A0AAJ1X4U9_9RHOB|nr:hypothetical protein [Rhodoalgimonas zhirmunskyi]MDQ2094628.1 hypothetical protein [Rhodoalgimonas zhirmunskyi]
MSDQTKDLKSQQAFQQGMMLALALALVPLAVISVGLFLSGYKPADFDTNLRYALLGIWLIFLLSVDRLSKLKGWLRVPFIKAEQSGEYLTVFAFSALIAALRLNPDMSNLEMITVWLKSFALLMALFLVMHAAFSAVRASWRRGKARKARKAARRNSGDQAQEQA